MQPLRATATLALLLGLAAAPRLSAETSVLWGKRGEAWTAESRLPDFSFAGYGRGERVIPQLAVTHDLKRDFGAVGDGKADDTAAFQRALAKVERGVILIPRGRYLITNIIEITKPNIVLRGEARDETVLFFPKTLTDAKPNWGATTTGDRTSNYSWSGGFIWAKGSYQNSKLAAVVGTVARGGRQIPVSNVDGLRVGQDVDIQQTDTPDDSLARHLYTDEAGDTKNLKARTRTSFVARITATTPAASGGSASITLDRPLRTELRAEWQPAVYRWAPTVTEVGIEDLTFEFPTGKYLGHFTELGYNPIAFSQVAHSWIKNIRLKNPESGPFVTGRFCTVDGVIYESDRKPDKARNATGHHGLTFGDGDNLFTNFDIRMQFQHDVTMGAAAAGNVVMQGKAIDMCFDHHRRAPYENLFTDIDVGAGTHPWRCGGGAGLGLHAAGRTTFWNIRASQPLTPPPAAYGPWSINVIGITTKTAASIAGEKARWFEPIAPKKLQPQNLYLAQKAKRLAQ